MSELTTSIAAPAPLVALTEDETLFRDTVRQFADEAVQPLVKEMDEKGVFEPSLIRQFFELGLMGIEIPEQYGGGGGTFFEAILAVEELSRGRCLGRRRSRCAEHAGQQRPHALDHRRAEEALPAAHVRRHRGRLRAQRSRLRLRRICASQAAPN